MEAALSPDDRGRLLAEARAAVADALAGRPPRPVAPEGVFARRAGVFVSFHLDGDLRGCIGHPGPDQPLATVVPECAVAAATGDPRFDAVSAGRTGAVRDRDLRARARSPTCATPATIVVGRDGLIAAQGWRRGLLLPQVAVEYGWDREAFLARTCAKAGLPPDAWTRGATISRFEAEVFDDAGRRLEECVMRRFAAVAVVVGLIGTVPAGAWGGGGHRLILDRAIALLPPELRAAFDAERAMLLAHASDPDLWRIAGFDDEAPRHFLDMDAYGPPPFSALPRDLGAAIERFGPETVTKNGLLPWRAAEMRGRLLRAFEAHKSGQRYGLGNAVYLTAVLAHYVADAHQPFHAVLNYDGQLTNQHGIHARFEDELPTRFGARLDVQRPRPRGRSSRRATRCSTR